VDRLSANKAARDQGAVAGALKNLRETARSTDGNVFAAEVEAVRAGVTQSEIIAALRDELGFGQPLVVA